MSVSIEVLVLRHGERIDEVPDSSIVNDRPKWDPPLTRNGYKQAAEAGVRLQGEHQRRPFERIYVSPCTRTFQTASFVAAQLGGVPLRPVPGLAECAAAVQKYGISAFDPKGQGPRFLASEQAGAYCAPGTTIEPTDALYSEGFEACVGRLASEAAAQGLTRVLLVSHREGIRDLCNLAFAAEHPLHTAASRSFGTRRTLTNTNFSQHPPLKCCRRAIPCRLRLRQCLMVLPSPYP
jgi:broad specificity phosphatase PhoE